MSDQPIALPSCSAPGGVFMGVRRRGWLAQKGPASRLAQRQRNLGDVTIQVVTPRRAQSLGRNCVPPIRPQCRSTTRGPMAAWSTARSMCRNWAPATASFSLRTYRVSDDAAGTMTNGSQQMPPDLDLFGLQVHAYRASEH